nr:type II secretion system protein GspK [Thiocapsa imhoffii]
MVLVLWVLTLLTVMALGLTAAQRTETALTENHLSGARFRVVADAAVAFTALHFMMPPPDAMNPDAVVWLPNGTAVDWRFAGVDLRIRVFNESSRIDLNEASPELLSALLTVLGVAEGEAVALAAAMVDWRDEDDLALLHGAEAAEYRQQERAVGPKNAPFMVVEELLQVLGMTPELYWLMAPEVSVDLDGVGYDERYASAVGFAAREGLTLEDAMIQIAERDAPLFEQGGGPMFVDRAGPLYRIEVSEEDERGLGRRMEALIEIMPGQQPPYEIRWRRFGLSRAAQEIGEVTAN